MVSDNEQPFVADSNGGGLNLASSSLFGAQLNCAAPSEPNEAALLPAANGTPELQQQPQPQARASVRFDPLAQLLGSDTEEDSTDAVGDSDSEIGDKENSPVGRPSVPLSAAHTGILDTHTTTTTTTDEEEEEEEGP
ncbi:hypothetical protein GGF44_005295, partial [Coemansia sp. RSA 1694]